MLPRQHKKRKVKKNASWTRQNRQVERQRQLKGGELLHSMGGSICFLLRLSTLTRPLLVLINIPPFAKPQTTMLTLIRSLPSMNGSHMLGQSSLVCKGSVAGITFERPILLMDGGDMLQEVILAFEQAPANGTRSFLAHARRIRRAGLDGGGGCVPRKQT